MKQTVIFFLVLLTWEAFSQTEKGSLLIGGTASISHTSYDFQSNISTSSNSASLSPTVGYFFMKNLAGGLSFPLSISSSKTHDDFSNSDTKISGKSLALGPFVRYYIPIGQIFILTEGAYSWSTNKSKIEQPNTSSGGTITTENSTERSNYRLSGGVAIFLNQHASADILLNYQKFGGDTPHRSTVFLSVGFQLYIPAGKK